jgi:heme A synthase
MRPRPLNRVFWLCYTHARTVFQRIETNGAFPAMKSSVPPQRFAKYTLIVLAWNLLTVLWGAYVRASGSGAGCGRHWPLCNGVVIPNPQQMQTVIEFAHRLLSGGALILIAAMVIWGFRIHPRGSPVRKGLVASGVFIITEALLGASLVLFGWVTTNVSAGRAIAMAMHLLNTFLLIGSLALTSWWASGRKGLALGGRGSLLWLFAIGVVGVIFVGMAGAITALGDTIFPSASLAQGIAEDFASGAHFLVRLRVYHPFIAIIVGVFLIYIAIRIIGKTENPDANRLATILIGLVALQWGIGLLNLLLLVPIWTQLTHLFMADLVWISLVLLGASSLSENDSGALPQPGLK